MRVFKTKRLDRWAKKEGLADKALWDAAKEVVTGNVEANLGQNLFKKRIARHGKGKSGGYRTIVTFKCDVGEKVFYVYGFAKNTKQNITCTEKDVLGIIAKNLLEATNEGLDILINNGGLIEIKEEHSNE